MKRACPTMNELLAFDAVARHESLTQAASELCVTVSAISKQLANLEVFLGHQRLLEKQGRGVQLTVQGRVYWQKVSLSLRAIETATYEVRSGNSGAGILTLASVPTFLTKWLIPRLPDFRREFPGITLSFSQHLAIGESIPPGVDAAIRYGSGDWPGTKADYIAGREFVLIAAPALLAQKPLSSPPSIINHTILHHEQASRAWQQWADHHGVPKVHLVSGPRFAQYSALIQATISGLGVGLVPRILVLDELAQGSLSVPCGEPAHIDQGHYLCFNVDRLELPVFASFRQWILEQGGRPA
jgi:LysR family glycine cleavage system transcriptional activator